MCPCPLLRQCLLSLKGDISSCSHYSKEKRKGPNSCLQLQINGRNRAGQCLPWNLESQIPSQITQGSAEQEQAHCPGQLEPSQPARRGTPSLPDQDIPGSPAAAAAEAPTPSQTSRAHIYIFSGPHFEVSPQQWTKLESIIQLAPSKADAT